MKFCKHCGKEIHQDAVVCVHCGCSAASNSLVSVVGAKSRLVAALLQIFLGSLGIGRFYLGYKQIAILQLILGCAGTAAGFINGLTNIPFIEMLQFASYAAVIWGIVDGVMILINKNFLDADGKQLNQ